MCDKETPRTSSRICRTSPTFCSSSFEVFGGITSPNKTAQKKQKSQLALRQCVKLKPVTVDSIFIHFIHLGNLYSAPSRNLLRGVPSPTPVKKISFQHLVAHRHSVALW